jgi:hypothetical protein
MHECFGKNTAKNCVYINRILKEILWILSSLWIRNLILTLYKFKLQSRKKTSGNYFRVQKSGDPLTIVKSITSRHFVVSFHLYSSNS